MIIHFTTILLKKSDTIMQFFDYCRTIKNGTGRHRKKRRGPSVFVIFIIKRKNVRNVLSDYGYIFDFWRPILNFVTLWYGGSNTIQCLYHDVEKIRLQTCLLYIAATANRIKPTRPVSLKFVFFCFLLIRLKGLWMAFTRS